jgi:hypothetical protein
MELFFVVGQVLNFGRKFIKNLNTHIIDALLEFGHLCWWKVQVGFLASVEGVYVSIS